MQFSKWLEQKDPELYEDVKSALDKAQLAADVAGVADPTPIVDLTNAGVSLVRGDLTGAALRAISAVPYAGDVIGKTGLAARAALKAGPKAVKAAKVGKKAVDKAVKASTKKRRTSAAKELGLPSEAIPEEK